MENQPAPPPINSNLKNLVIISIAITAIILVCTLPRACSKGTEVDERSAKGLSAAKAAARYLSDLHDLTNDPPAFDKKWRWAWQEIDSAEKAGFDKDLTEELRCSHSGFAGVMVTGSSGNAFSCLSNVQILLTDRYGK